MENVRLRTKLQLSLLLISSLLLCSTLLIVHHTVKTQVQREIFEDLHNSVSTSRNVMLQREVMQARSTALISELPSVKALMTTHDAAIIQDASRETWHLAGSDLFILADRQGKVVALHTSAPGFNLSFTVVNLTNKVTPYNFLSTFSGTHFVTPRSYTGQVTFNF